jgi:hypothetical protein
MNQSHRSAEIARAGVPHVAIPRKADVLLRSRTKARAPSGRPLREVLALLALWLVLIVSSGAARAQTLTRMTIDPWRDNDLAETFDHLVFEKHGQADNNPSGSQVFWWDSFGRVRFSRQDQDSPFVAYRILTIGAGTDSQFIKSSMLDMSISAGFQLGEIAGWRASTVLGVGYSSTHPFVHTTGIFGVGHLTFDRPLDDAGNSLALSIDYEGNGAFLPDVPLPGFAFIHRDPKLDYALGYPMSKLTWRPIDPVEISARYDVPYSASIDAEYRLAKHFGLYANAANFFQGFVVARSATNPTGDITNRQFYQMRRVETGVRFMFDPWIDASIGIGYAFDQTFSTGFDVRNLTTFSSISNEPYIALVLRGTF